MAVDRWGHAMARKAEPSTESIAAAEKAAAAWRIHKNSGVSYVPPRSTGSVALALETTQAGPDTLADTARAAIDGHWQKHRGGLGNPVQGGQLFVVDRDGGRASMYEGGTVYWWPDKGPIAVTRVVVRYRGMNCFSETDEWSGSDEPYLIIGFQGEGGQGTHSPTHYRNVDAGGSFPYPIFDVYDGSPGRGLLLPVVLMERDQGDPAHYHSLVATATGAVIGGVITVVGLVASAGVAAAATPVLVSATPFIVEAIDSALGSEDDHVGQTVLAIPAKDLCWRWQQPFLAERDIQYDLATDLITDDDAGYKAYFEIETWTYD
jgi:hypothetical protein